MGWIVEVGTLDDLLAQVLTSLIGGIEEVVGIVIPTTDQVVDKGTSVTAQSCAVTYDALGVETYDHSS